MNISLIVRAVNIFNYPKLRIWARTESFFKVSDFEYLEILTAPHVNSYPLN